MKAFLTLIFLLAFTSGVQAYIPDRAITFSSNQLSPGKVLLASEQIKEGIFARSVILLIRHNDNGDLGLIINRPSNHQVHEVFPDFINGEKAGDVYIGGPVMNAVLSVLVKAKDDGDVAGLEGVLGHIYHGFVGRQDAADKYLSAGVEAVRFYSGYAGWGKGQLLNEINRGGWYVMQGDPDLVFDRDAETLWQALMQKVRGR